MIKIKKLFFTGLVSVLAFAGPQEDAQLLDAVRMGSDATVKDLIQNKGANVNATTPKGGTPLMTAASNNNVDLIRFYLDQGADINAQNQDGVTALMWAAIYGRKEAVEELINYKQSKFPLDISLKSNKGKTVLDYAQKRGDKDILATMEIVEKIPLQVLQDLRTEGINVHAISQEFVNAVLKRDPNKLALLLNAGADPNAQVQGNMPALFWAVQSNDPVMAIMLMHGGASLVWNGKTALHAAVNLKEVQRKPGNPMFNTDLIQYIVENHPDIINNRDSQGQTALGYVARFAPSKAPVFGGSSLFEGSIPGDNSADIIGILKKAGGQQ